MWLLFLLKLIQMLRTYYNSRKGNRELFWGKMQDIQDNLGVKNISDLVKKEILGRYDIEHPEK